MRVLIIDGNSELLDVYRAIFEEAKVEVCTCYSVCLSEQLSSSQPIGMDCFQSFFKRKPRLVFD